MVHPSNWDICVRDLKKKKWVHRPFFFSFCILSEPNFITSWLFYSEWDVLYMCVRTKSKSYYVSIIRHLKPMFWIVPLGLKKCLSHIAVKSVFKLPISARLVKIAFFCWVNRSTRSPIQYNLFRTNQERAQKEDDQQCLTEHYTTLGPQNQSVGKYYMWFKNVDRHILRLRKLWFLRSVAFAGDKTVKKSLIQIYLTVIHLKIRSPSRSERKDVLQSIFTKSTACNIDFWK